MGANTLVDTDKQPASAPKKKRRERIQLIEEPPRPEWFQRTTDTRNRPLWFLRFHATGLRLRRYGPFPSKHKALLFLDLLLNKVGDALMDAGNYIDDYRIKDRQFHYRGGHYPVVEDELIRVREKGR